LLTGENKFAPHSALMLRTPLKERTFTFTLLDTLFRILSLQLRKMSPTAFAVSSISKLEEKSHKIPSLFQKALFRLEHSST
jgi:hypothetical protein